MDWKDPTSEPNAAGQSSRSGASVGVIRCTFGTGEAQSAPWTDVRDLAWPDLATLLTTHGIGQKDGPCIVPATFRGTRREKKEAARIELVMLDSDSGATLEEIASAIRARGYAGLISSTHSHLNDTTRVKRGAYETWLSKVGRSADEPDAAGAYLIERKGMLARIASGTVTADQDETHITLRHQSCPKFRIALPLARPWIAASYESQAKANAAWKERIEALADALHLHHDQSCTDTSRLFYLPRRPTDGPPAETCFLDGTWCDIFELPAASKAPKSRRGKDGRAPSGGVFDFGRDPHVEFENPDTGEILDLTLWAAAAGRHFRIVDALRGRSPGIFVGKVAGGVRHHIVCPNSDAHTDSDPDAATFVCNPGDSSDSKGFVIHCRHAHCDGRDRLLFVKQMLEQKALLQEDLENAAFQPTAPPPKPLVRVTGGNLPAVVQQAEDALIGPPHRAYQRGACLVRPGLMRLGVGDADTRSSLRIVPFEDHALAEAMTAAARWQRYDGRSKSWIEIDAPTKVAAVLQQRRGLWRLPILAGILSAPTLRPDGTALHQPGYDTATGLLLAPGKTIYPAVLDRPTKDQALVALSRLDDLIGTFPFVDEPSRSTALSGILTASVRRSLRTAPMHGFTAPVAGSGKSKLVDLCSVIATGRTASVIAQGRTEEELEKRLGALLLGGEHVIAIDNCEATLGGEFLCSLITQEFVRCRILGKSEAPELPTNSFVTATGNNLTLVGDMTRRSILCQLDPQVERPELRTFDNDPVNEARLRRPELLVAALTVLRAYHVAGFPDAPDPLGSFEDWSTWVRGALIWLGRADPVNTMEAIRDHDPKLEALIGFITQWQQHLGQRSVTVREIIECASEQRPASTLFPSTSKFVFVRPDFREALLVVAGENGAINSRRLGRWISGHQGRVVGGLRIARAPMLAGNQRWKLDKEGSHEPAA